MNQVISAQSPKELETEISLMGCQLGQYEGAPIKTLDKKGQVKLSWSSILRVYCHTLLPRGFNTILGLSLVAQTVKNLPEMWETWVRSLGWEDPLE